MTGWRVGYIAAEKAIADACEKMQGQITSGTCSIAQKAAFAALTGDQTPTREMAAAFLRRRNLVLQLAADIPGLKTFAPDGAFYLFPDVSSYYGKRVNGQTISGSMDLALYLLSEAKVSTVPGIAFGDENCIRISFAASDETLTDAFGRIAAALAKLQPVY